MSVQVCKWECKSADVAGDNGALVTKWFGLTAEQIEATFGRFTKGKNKGKLRGWIVYRKCSVGGWCFPIRGVVRPGLIFAILCPTWEEFARWSDETTDKFLAAASRVDSAYGSSPEIRREQQAQRQAEVQKELDAKADKRLQLLLQYQKAWPAFVGVAGQEHGLRIISEQIELLHQEIAQRYV